MTDYRKQYLLEVAIDYIQQIGELADFLECSGEVFNEEEMNYFGISDYNRRILRLKGLTEE